MRATMDAERYALMRLRQAVRAGLISELPPPGRGGYAEMWRQFSGSDYFQNAARGAGYQDPGFYLRHASQGVAPGVVPMPAGGYAPGVPARPRIRLSEETPGAEPYVAEQPQSPSGDLARQLASVPPGSLSSLPARDLTQPAPAWRANPPSPGGLPPNAELAALLRAFAYRAV
jgi:hypothetical protein